MPITQVENIQEGEAVSFYSQEEEQVVSARVINYQNASN